METLFLLRNIKRIFNMVKHFIFLSFLLLQSCKKDDTIGIINEPYTGKELRIDGYFYQRRVGESTSVVVLYRNGVLLNAQAFDKNLTFGELETELTSKSRNDMAKKTRTDWSFFKIQNKSIEYELWEPTLSKKYIFSQYGTILNDSTFVITKMKDRCDKETDRNDTFRFKQFLAKPDSTNSFL